MTMVREGAKVLDIGCGDGDLLINLEKRRLVEGRGLEISQKGVNACVAKGLMVIQGDADTDLDDYPADAFDDVILSQTLQATRQPRRVLQNMLRIGRRVIVSFPNFGHWCVRLKLLCQGQMPKTTQLPNAWYESPNIHLCTIKDFIELVEDLDANIEQAIALGANGKPYGPLKGDSRPQLWAWNIMAEQAIFCITKTPSTTA